MGLKRFFLFFCLPVLAYGAQRSADEIARSVTYLPPVQPLESVGISRGLPSRASRWCFSKLTFYEASPVSREITPDEAQGAQEFLLAAREAIETHRVHSPWSYLTDDELEDLKKGLLNAAHVWLTYHKIEHRLLLSQVTQTLGAKGDISRLLWLRPAGTPGDRLKRFEADLDGRVLFDPEKIVESGNVNHFSPVHGSVPRKAIAGLGVLYPPWKSSISLSIDSLLELPDRWNSRLCEMWTKYFHQARDIGRQQFGGGLGFVEGHPSLPIDSRYMARYLEEWYGLQPRDIPLDLPYASPWGSHLFFMQTQLDTDLLFADVGEHQDLADLNGAIQDLRRRVQTLARRMAHLSVVADTALESLKQLRAPDRGGPFQWTENTGITWVRFDAESVQRHHKDRESLGTSTLTVVLALPASEKRLHERVVEQVRFLKALARDRLQLTSYMQEFLASPENQPEFCGNDLSPVRLRFQAFLQALKQPSLPWVSGYEPLTTAALREEYAGALRALQAAPKCGPLF